MGGGEEECVYESSWKALARTRHRWEDNNTMGLKERE
jgi:hypothetical protein